MYTFWPALTSAAKHENASVKFPNDFKFGVSTSAHQVEGAWIEDGKGISVWDYLSHVNPVAIDYEANGDVACDSYHLYKRDIEMLEELGVNSYNVTTLSSGILVGSAVSKVSAQQPYPLSLPFRPRRPGPCSSCSKEKCGDNCTDIGGLLSDKFPIWFGDYARVLYKNFGDRVKYWMTISEPYIHCKLVFELADHAPQVYTPGVGFYKCIKNILMAHARAYHIYYNEFQVGQNGKISIDANLDWPIASTNSTEDKEAVLDYMAFRFGLFMDPIYKGNYPQRVIDRVSLMSSKQGMNGSRLPPLSHEEVKYIKGTTDYLALNHYSSDMVYRNNTKKYQVPSLWGDGNYETYKDPAWPQSVQPWICYHPPGFYNILIYVKETYNNPPIHIIESGYSTKGGLVDDDRVLYIRGYLTALNKAIEDGVRVEGYFVWSLMDMFEWTTGYTQKFGLYEVDFNDPNRTRTARKSALVYKEIIRSRAIDYDYNPDPAIGRNGANVMTWHVVIGLAMLEAFILRQ